MNRTSQRIILVLMIIPWVWLFGRALVGSETFVYRDAAHYYYPLIQWTTDHFRVGEIPLWNAHENLGAPLAADPTASLFYPGKFLFFLPVSFVFAYKLYIALHSLLALATSYKLARHWKANEVGAAIAAVSFTFGGYVAFQYCNVIYLISAAWLPLALLFGDRLLHERKCKWCILLAMCFAMMVLGGDPQAAYHTGLLLGTMALPKLFWRRNSPDPSEEIVGQIRPIQSLCWLGLASALGLAMSAANVLPALQWAKHTDRHAFDNPRSIYEIPVVMQRDTNNKMESVRQGLLGTPKTGHAAAMYSFSVAPWHYAELIWPNFYGKSFPSHKRWGQVIRGEGRIWVQSLYFGLLPLLLAISSFTSRPNEYRDRWLRTMVVLACIAAIGWYGIGWLQLELTRGIFGGQRAELTGHPVGGLYWMMTTFLPGYAMFRYPAKLFLIASLLFSMLAGRQFGRIQETPQHRWLWISGVVSIVSLILLIGVAVLPLTRLTLPIPSKSGLFGPFNAEGCWYDLLLTFSQTMLVSGAIFFVLRSHWKTSISWLPTAALMLTVVDVCLANGWMVRLAPQELWTRKIELADVIVSDAPVTPAPVRIHRAQSWSPPAWRNEASVTRQADGMAYDAQVLAPKYNMLRGSQRKLSNVIVGGSTSNQVITQLALRSKYDGLRPKGNGNIVHLSLDYIQMLGTQYLITPGSVEFEKFERIDTSQCSVKDIGLWRIPDPAKSAWIVHQVSFIESPDRRHNKALDEFAHAVMFPHNKLFDWRNVALVEGFPGRTEKHSMPPEDEVESCELVSWSETEVSYNVDLAAPGYMVQNGLHTKDWRAYMQAGDSEVELPVHKTNLIVRGVFLPKGKNTITFRYVPRAFYMGSAVSVLAWCFGLGMLCFGGRLERRETGLPTS